MVIDTTFAPVGASSVLPHAPATGQPVVLGGGVGRGLHDLPTAENGMIVRAACQSAGAQGDVWFYQPDKFAVGLLLEPFKGFRVPPGEVCFPSDAEVQVALLPQLDICGLVDLQQRVGHQLTSTYQ